MRKSHTDVLDAALHNISITCLKTRKGRPDADIWFIGMGEAGGGEVNIRTRIKFRSVEDNTEAHKMLGVNSSKIQVEE